MSLPPGFKNQFGSKNRSGPVSLKTTKIEKWYVFGFYKQKTVNWLIFLPIFYLKFKY
jgi:hypothetical protein